MFTATFAVAEALPVQPVTVTDDSTVALSGIATSVPLVCAAQVGGAAAAPVVSVQVSILPVSRWRCR